MAIRPNMTPIVELFREKAQVGETETFNGVTYWTDEQLEEILDKAKRPDTPILTLVNESHGLWNVELPHWYWVDPDTIDIQNSSGTSLYSAVSYSDPTLTITGFGTFDLKNNTLDGAGDDNAYQIFGMWINLYDALADIWDRRASQRYDYIQMKAGQNVLRMQNEYEHCIQQRDYYRGKIARAHKRTGTNDRWVVS